MNIFKKTMSFLMVLLLAFQLSGCGLFKKDVPMTEDDIKFLENKVENYAEKQGYIFEHNESVEGDDLVEYKNIAYIIYLNDDREKYIDFYIFLDSPHFTFDIWGFNDDELWSFVNDFAEFTNEFSKYKITKNDLVNFYNDDDYYDGYTKEMPLDFWENALLSYTKGYKSYGEYVTPEFSISNELSY